MIFLCVLYLSLGHQSSACVKYFSACREGISRVSVFEALVACFEDISLSLVFWDPCRSEPGS